VPGSLHYTVGMHARTNVRGRAGLTYSDGFCAPVQLSVLGVALVGNPEHPNSRATLLHYPEELVAGPLMRFI
jgi:hypothetical protein